MGRTAAAAAVSTRESTATGNAGRRRRETPRSGEKTRQQRFRRVISFRSYRTSPRRTRHGSSRRKTAHARRRLQQTLLRAARPAWPRLSSSAETKSRGSRRSRPRGNRADPSARRLSGLRCVRFLRPRLRGTAPGVRETTPIGRADRPTVPVRVTAAPAPGVASKPSFSR